MLMKPRFQTRSHAGGLFPRRCPEGLRASARFARPQASSLPARAPAPGRTVEFPSFVAAIPAVSGLPRS